MRPASRHSVPIAAGFPAGYSAPDRLGALQPLAAFGMTAPLITACATGAFVSEQQRVTTCLHVHQQAIACVSRLGSVRMVAAVSAHQTNRPLAAIGEDVRVTPTEPEEKRSGLPRGRSIIAPHGERPTIASVMNGAAVSLMLAIARTNGEARE